MYIDVCIEKYLLAIFADLSISLIDRMLVSKTEFKIAGIQNH